MLISTYDIKNKKIKNNYKIALISDFHNCRYKKVLNNLSKNVDAILMPGDFVIRYLKGKRTRVNSFLSELVKIAPVYCCLGNHDYKTMSKKAFCNMISTAGANVLLNSKINFSEDLSFAGWYNEEKQTDFDRLYDKSRFNILLSHKPEWYYSHLRDTSFELVVSGHAHGGQVRLFNQGLYAPGQGLLPKLTRGIYDNRLIVTAGIGNPVHLPRLFNPREIVILNLMSEN